MPDLQLAPPRESSRWPIVLIAVAALTLIAAAMYKFLPKSTSNVTITNARIFAPHTVFDPLPGGRSVHVVGQKQQTEDDLYVVLTISIKDEFHMPISADGASATLSTADGAVNDGNTVARSDIQRLDQIFPELAALTPRPLGFGDEINPGETVEKQVVIQFPRLNASAWQTKKALTLTVSMHNQPAQTVVLQ